MTQLRILGKNPFAWFFVSVRRFGFFQTMTVIWSVLVDMWFDVRYGTETARRIPRQQIQTDSENLVHCVNYGASKAMPFLRLMAQLDLPKDAVFVDLGSGKGKAVMLASRYGFRKVIGVEFSGDLCRRARANLEQFLKRRPSRSAIEIVESDVTKYQFHDDESVFFMLDPFNAPVLAAVLANLRASLERRPRPVWLIYSVPRERKVIEDAGIFTRSQSYLIVGSEFQVYSNPASA